MSMQIQTKEMAYMLGLLWADGYLNKNGSIFIYGVVEDMDFLSETLLKTGKWTFYKRHRANRKPSYSAYLNDKNLYSFLVEQDYRDRTKSADKILSHLSDELIPYWFRGLSDGDGSFYISKDSKTKQFGCTSGAEQDWSFFSSLLDRLGVKYGIQRLTKETNKAGRNHSTIRVCGNNILGLGDYIYKTYLLDRIGLPRKYDKYSKIKETYLGKVSKSKASLIFKQ